jgi:arsenate reductase
MAEGFLRAWTGDRLDVSSAGTEARGVHPFAIRVMAEVGIDLAGHHAKTVDTLLDRPWDYVVTVCDDARERCPVFPEATTRLHWSFEDPSSASGDEAERLRVFRRVRDQIAARLRAWLASEAPPPSP